MKKSLLALAVLATFAGAASAQSSVTIYGRLDQAYGKVQGSNVSGLMDPSGSRIGFKGEEDLGGGLKALFNLEHRFYADDGLTPYKAPSVVGAASSAGFWGARSVVGLKGGFGQILLGREYDAAFLGLENPMDPYKGDTIATLKPMSLGGITPARFSNSINYTFAAEGFTGIVSWAPKEATAAKNQYALAANYAAGPIFVALAYTNPNTDQTTAVTDTNNKAKWTTVAGSYDLGVVKIGALFGTGNRVNDDKIRSWALTAVAPLGNGQVRSLYGQRKNKTTDANEVKQFSLGYWYSLSKRTTVYADLVNDAGTIVKASNHNKTGYEIGVKHEF